MRVRSVIETLKRKNYACWFNKFQASKPARCLAKPLQKLIKMKPIDWPKYISMLLTKNDTFHLVKSERNGQTEIDIYSDNL